MQLELIESYKYFRNSGASATSALAQARGDIAASRRRYTRCWRWQYGAGFGQPHADYGHKALRFYERPGDLFRYTGTSYDIAREEGRARDIPQGWYTLHENYDVSTSGVVYQLPARNGVSQYVAGYSDPLNNGPACLSFDQFFGDKLNAAYAANRLAELMAADSREYDEAWQAGVRYSWLDKEAAVLRRDLLAYMKDAKGAAPLVAQAFPRLSGYIRASMKPALAELEKMRRERAKLYEAFGETEAFADGQY
jgi:hypothetical protein